jgi:hypothetical protein
VIATLGTPEELTTTSDGTVGPILSSFKRDKLAVAESAFSTFVPLFPLEPLHLPFYLKTAN